MSHVGLPIPAKDAKIGLIDGIFTLFSGECKQ